MFLELFVSIKEHTKNYLYTTLTIYKAQKNPHDNQIVGANTLWEPPHEVNRQKPLNTM